MLLRALIFCTIFQLHNPEQSGHVANEACPLMLVDVMTLIFSSIHRDTVRVMVDQSRCSEVSVYAHLHSL